MTTTSTIESPNSMKKSPLFKTTSYLTDPYIKANQKYFGRKTDTAAKSIQNSYVTPFRNTDILKDLTTVKAHSKSYGTSTRKIISNDMDTLTVERSKLCQQLTDKNDKFETKNLFHVFSKISIQKSCQKNIFLHNNCETQKATKIREKSAIEPNILVYTKKFEDKCDSKECINVNKTHPNKNNFTHDKNCHNFDVIESTYYQNLAIKDKSFNNQDEKRIIQSNINLCKKSEEINEKAKESLPKSLIVMDKIFRNERQFLNFGQINEVKSQVINDTNDKLDEVPKIKSIYVQKSKEQNAVLCLNSKEKISKAKSFFPHNFTKDSDIGISSQYSLILSPTFEIKENKFNDSPSLITITDSDKNIPFSVGNVKSNILSVTKLETIKALLPEVQEDLKIYFKTTENSSKDFDNSLNKTKNKIRKRDLFESNIFKIFIIK